MYEVSQAYLDAMKSEEQEHILYGTIGSYEFDRSNILRGSFSITNQCSDGQEMKIGQVYVGQLQGTFINTSVPRNSWRGQEITVYFGLKVEGGTYEEVPLGIYTVEEANWTASGVEVTAYDHMAKFDIPYRNFSTVGNAYPMINLACYYAGVTFGMTEEEVEALPNGQTAITAYPDNDMETWRDCISWIAQLLCCFATIDRAGNLVMRQYGGEPVDTIDSSHRFTGASFSDYETKYTGISIVEMASGVTKYYSVEPDDGLTYSLGSNPYMQYGTDAHKDAVRNTVLGAIQEINFVPFKVTAIGNPAYDLGDTLVFEDGLADSTKESCITRYVFTYNDNYEMQGVGKNPALSTAKSRAEKSIAGLRSEVSAGDYIVYSYVNSEALTVGSESWTQIVSLDFTTVNPRSKIQEWTEIKLDVTPSGDDPVVVYVKYKVNSIEEPYQPVETYSEDGYHTLSLLYFIGEISENTEYNWGVFLKVSGGTASIAVGDVHSTIAGQGLAAEVGESETDIEFSDEFVGYTLSGRLTPKTFNDDLVVDVPVPADCGPSDTFAGFAIYRGTINVTHGSDDVAVVTTTTT